MLDEKIETLACDKWVFLADICTVLRFPANPAPDLVRERRAAELDRKRELEKPPSTCYYGFLLLEKIFAILVPAVVSSLS